MSEKDNAVKIFTMKQEFPCGPKSACCGPVGQTEGEISELKNAIEELDLKVEVFDIPGMDDETKQKHPKVIEVLEKFGLGAIPVITVSDELTCIGQSAGINETLAEIKKKL
jgi:hypothetical protein